MHVLPLDLVCVIFNLQAPLMVHARRRSVHTIAGAMATAQVAPVSATQVIRAAIVCMQPALVELAYWIFLRCFHCPRATSLLLAAQLDCRSCAVTGHALIRWDTVLCMPSLQLSVLLYLAEKVSSDVRLQHL